MTESKIGVKEIFFALTNEFYGGEPFLRNRQTLRQSRISQHFMEPEDSLPCSQELSTDLYPEPDQSS
jgi:hypothetical protein